MPDRVFNISKGSVVEKVRDNPVNIGVLLLKTAQADDTLSDYDDVASMLTAGGGVVNVEADATNYVRKTGITGTIIIDDVNNWVDVDIPDPTWVALGNGVNNDLPKAILFYEEAPADATRIPLTHHDFGATSTGSDLTLQVAPNGFFRAQGVEA